MLSTLLMILGIVLILITAMIGGLFIIAGLRRSFEDLKELLVSAVIGLLLIVLGALPLENAVIVGSAAVAVGGFAFFFLLAKGKFGGMPNVRMYISREYAKPVLRFLIRIGAVAGAILLADVIGLSIFLTYLGQWDISNLTQLLTILLLLEGALLGAAGGFMFLGYSEYGLLGQAAINPALAREQRDKWKDRRVSQQKWGIAMLIIGTMLIFLGLLVSL